MNRPVIAITAILLIGCSSCASPVDRLSRLEGEELHKAVINEFEQRHFDVVYMLSSIGDPASKKDELNLLIKHYDHIEKTLILLLDERQYAKRATELLMAFGGDEALSEIFRRAKDYVSPEDVFHEIIPAGRGRQWNNVFECIICKSLASPSNDEQWDYMRRCRCAKMNCPLGASNDPGSLELLKVFYKKKIEEINSQRFELGSEYKRSLESTKEFFDSLIKSKEEHPGGFPAANVSDAISNAFPVLVYEEGDQYKAKYFIQYNNRRDIAWVNLDFEIMSSGNVLVFTKKDDSWSLKAVWHKPISY